MIRGLIAFVAAIAATVSVASATPSAQAAYAERRGLIEADNQCRLFAPNVRAALDSSAAQARGALLRGGWTSAQVADLERAAANAARARACNDPRTLASANDARAGFAAWAHAPTMSFPGRGRSWFARRYCDAAGWLLSQDIPTPVVARFGVRQRDNAEHLTLVLPRSSSAPASAELAMRDPARANTSLLEWRGRASMSLEGGAPAAQASLHFLANARRVEPLPNNQAQLAFEFPDAAFRAMLALDPRDTVQIVLQTRTGPQILLVDAGDIAAARAFLTIR